jgi:hypothetical protein
MINSEPRPKWETFPASYYSMRASSIVLRLYFRVSYPQVRFCLENDLLPPPRLRQARLQLWLDGAREAISRRPCHFCVFR